MKIYSWNIWFRNKRFEEALLWIRNLDFDVLCLQEVPEEFLESLKTLPCEIYYAAEIDRMLGGVQATHYIVVLSRKKIVNAGSISLPDWNQRISFRTRLFVSGMVALGFWSWGDGNRHAVFIDVETKEGRVRVYNVHFSLTFPEGRRREFDIALQGRDANMPAIIAGDFNIIESPNASILNWLLGGRFTDAILWKRERRIFGVSLERYGFKNPLEGKKTHAISASQLDHILVPAAWKVKRAEVYKDALGSDHKPVLVEAEPV